MKTYIVLDESGAMHLKNERYFVIAGFITRELHKVTSSHKRVEEVVKQRKNIPINQKIELKSSHINDSQQALFLNELYSLSDVVPIAIVVDKENLKKFGASENVAYNFFVKTLLKYLFKCNIPILQTNQIELRIDNRNTSVKALKDLETFLQWEFELMDLEVEVKYLDSKDNRDVQMADYVANLVWKKHNRPNEDLSRRVPQYYRTYISKFPFKLFGHNPSIKQLEEEKEKNLEELVVNS
ncbi:MAG: DUF3800 domain-containing protein [Candidatus Faecisoma sp.]|nr:DUF3800 domain-containing protein [Acholeplasma sp.]MDY2893029.1 DUF3800 domain-containing protein [Candidatus Faecisoma sp.]